MGLRSLGTSMGGLGMCLRCWMMGWGWWGVGVLEWGIRESFGAWLRGGLDVVG